MSLAPVYIDLEGGSASIGSGVPETFTTPLFVLREVPHRSDAKTRNNMEGFIPNSASYLLLLGLGGLLALVAVKKFVLGKGKRYAPGPKPWPILGSLHLLSGYDIPYKAFDILSKKYGPVVKLRLGQVDCLVVSSLDTVKEVLMNKGEHFDSRPSFMRYKHLFGGNKDNGKYFQKY